MKLRDLRRKVEGKTICDKGHLRWDCQKVCMYFIRTSLAQDQCDYCQNGEGWCELSYEDEIA